MGGWELLVHPRQAQREMFTVRAHLHVVFNSACVVIGTLFTLFASVQYLKHSVITVISIVRNSKLVPHCCFEIQQLWVLLSASWSDGLEWRYLGSPCRQPARNSL